MRIYKIEQNTILNTDISNAWEFFSSPENLNRITPDDLQFEILSDIAGIKMYPGMIINYRIMPFPGIKMGWTTEITHCEDKKFFVDEQRFGPYAFWHHQHHFKAVGNHVVMTDIVHYGIPFGFIGRIMNSILIRKKLEGIFEFREKVVKEIFG